MSPTRRSPPRNRRLTQVERAQRRAFTARMVVLLVGLGLFTALVFMARRACNVAHPSLTYKQRKLHFRPIPFDRERAPRHIRVLRTGKLYEKKGCAGSYRQRCIQKLPLEEYVRGVVRAEEGVFEGRARRGGRVDRRRLGRIQEAWKLQAIAARTYAIYCAVADKYYTKSSGFHLTDSERDQVYGDRRSGAIDRAVAATKGKVLVDARDRLIYAEYSASCGGRGTRDVVRRKQRIRCHRRCAEFAFRGSTHRRGMCQWGSYLYALDGHRLDRLLARYYPNARPVRLK